VRSINLSYNELQTSSILIYPLWQKQFFHSWGPYALRQLSETLDVIRQVQKEGFPNLTDSANPMAALDILEAGSIFRRSHLVWLFDQRKQLEQRYEAQKPFGKRNHRQRQACSDENGIRANIDGRGSLSTARRDQSDTKGNLWGELIHACNLPISVIHGSWSSWETVWVVRGTGMRSWWYHVESFNFQQTGELEALKLLIITQSFQLRETTQRSSELSDRWQGMRISASARRWLQLLWCIFFNMYWFKALRYAVGWVRLGLLGFLVLVGRLATRCWTGPCLRLPEQGGPQHCCR